MSLLRQLLQECLDPAIAKPDDLKELMREVALCQDQKGYFVRTHRARSDSYESPHKIPKSVTDKIAQTG